MKITSLLCFITLSAAIATGQNKWAEFPESETHSGWIDSGSFLGHVYPFSDEFIFSADLQNLIYVPENSPDANGGGWVWIYRGLDVPAMGELEVTHVQTSRVADNSLFFSNGRYNFGPQISAWGDSVKVHGDYAYVTWYMGGMENRYVMLSRKRLDGDEWETIQFPHQHIGFRGDPEIGDSHNTIAVGIAGIDGTVHLLYDMHAYTRQNQPDDYFNYNISVPGAATAENWDISLFSEKRDYLRQGVVYEGVTYPNFLTNDEGELLATWRIGGDQRGSYFFSVYDDNGWSNNLQLTNGNINSNPWGPYGSLKYIQGKYRLGLSIRLRDRGDFGYQLNSGFYYAYSDDPSGINDWRNIDGEPLNRPIANPDLMKIGEPNDFGVGNRIPVAARWTLTDNGSLHFGSTVSGTNVHYYKGPGDDDFTIATTGIPNGGLFSVGNTVFIAGIENGRVTIYATPAATNDWELLYQSPSTETYRHGVYYLRDNELFYFAQHEGSSDSLPIDFLHLRLDGVQ